MTVEQYKNLWNYFLTLEQDLQNTSKFVEHCEDNFKTYSFEFYKIIQLSCAEIDSSLKELCEFFSPGSKPDRITKYAKIIIPNYPELHRCSTYMSFSGAPLVFLPWKDWTISNSPLWWRDYQKLKHNHTEHFNLATLENAYLSLSALMLISQILKDAFDPNELNFCRIATQRLSIGRLISNSLNISNNM